MPSKYTQQLKCDLCPFKTKWAIPRYSKLSITNHKKEHHETKQFECKHCKEKFSFKYKLNRHSCKTLCEIESLVPASPELQLTIEPEHQNNELTENDFLVQKVNQASIYYSTPVNRNVWTWQKAPKRTNNHKIYEGLIPKKLFKNCIQNKNTPENSIMIKPRKRLNLPLLKYDLRKRQKTNTEVRRYKTLCPVSPEIGGENLELSDRIPGRNTQSFYNLTPLTPTQRFFPHLTKYIRQ